MASQIRQRRATNSGGAAAQQTPPARRHQSQAAATRVLPAAVVTKDEPILFTVRVHAPEWRPDAQPGDDDAVIVRDAGAPREQPAAYEAGRLTRTWRALCFAAWQLAHPLTAPPVAPSAALVKARSACSEWTTALSPNQQLIAVATETGVIVRTASSKFSDRLEVTCHFMDVDIRPGTRCVAWSAASNFLAVGVPSGAVYIFAANSTNLLRIGTRLASPPRAPLPTLTLPSLFPSPLHADDATWVHAQVPPVPQTCLVDIALHTPAAPGAHPHLLVLGADGLLRRCSLGTGPDGGATVQAASTLDLVGAGHHTCVTALTYDSDRCTLGVAGGIAASERRGRSKACTNSVTVWHVHDDAPYYTKLGAYGFPSQRVLAAGDDSQPASIDGTVATTDAPVWPTPLQPGDADKTQPPRGVGVPQHAAESCLRFLHPVTLARGVASFAGNVAHEAGWVAATERRAVLALRWSKRAQFLAALDTQGAVAVWDVTRGKRVLACTGSHALRNPVHPTSEAAQRAAAAAGGARSPDRRSGRQPRPPLPATLAAEDDAHEGHDSTSVSDEDARIVGIQWWSSNALLCLHAGGTVSVRRLQGLDDPDDAPSASAGGNLLGPRPEQFRLPAALSAAGDDTSVMVLECSRHHVRRSRRWSQLSDGDADDAADDAGQAVDAAPGSALDLERRRRTFRLGRYSLACSCVPPLSRAHACACTQCPCAAPRPSSSFEPRCSLETLPLRWHWQRPTHSTLIRSTWRAGACSLCLLPALSEAWAPCPTPSGCYESA